ncbi:MAG: hypothetical protein ABIZ57_08570 [Candidatus Limnocylindria bacterium]
MSPHFSHRRTPMVKMISTIDGSGFPLGFRVSAGQGRPLDMSDAAKRCVVKVEARALNGHQKEAIVEEGAGGASWRMVSDEGPYLKGTDLAPFPLGFFNVGLQADLLNRLQIGAEAAQVKLDFVELEIDNLYSFSGSFFKGTGQGVAGPAVVRLRIRSSAPAGRIATLVRQAVHASPAMAAMRTPLQNTFALYVNGARRTVGDGHASAAADVLDPFKAHKAPPRPRPEPADLADLITKLPVAIGASEVMPESGAKFELKVLGSSRFVGGASITESQTTLERPVGSHFAFRSDEFGAGTAPSGLAYQAAGVSFCYMTQLLRYAEYLKYKVSEIRIVQFNPYSLAGDLGEGTLEGVAEPVDTHLFLDGEEPDDVLQKLLIMGARTCYLHAALGAALQPEVVLELNGAVIAT